MRLGRSHISFSRRIAIQNRRQDTFSPSGETRSTQKVTGPLSLAANLFAVPGSSERARLFSKSISNTKSVTRAKRSFSVVYGESRSAPRNRGGVLLRHLSGFPSCRRDYK